MGKSSAEHGVSRTVGEVIETAPSFQSIPDAIESQIIHTFIFRCYSGVQLPHSPHDVLGSPALGFRSHNQLLARALLFRTDTGDER